MAGWSFGIGPGTIVDSLVLHIALLFGRLPVAVGRALRLVNVLVDTILGNGTLSCVTHAPMHRTSHARSSVDDHAPRAVPTTHGIQRVIDRFEADALRDEQVER